MSGVGASSRFLVAAYVLVLGFLCGACRVPPAVPALPSKGGPRWVEVSSAHFTIWTDSPARAKSLVERMERLREAIFGTALFGRRDEGYRTFVIAFANEEEVGAYLPPQFSAYASGPGALFQPVIVVAADALDTIETRRIFTHELAHVISFGPLPNQPRWFAEALASFYETADLDGTKVTLGKPLEGRARELRSKHALPLEAVFACRETSCMTSQFYSTVWAMFTFLATEHAQELVAYMNLLATTPVAEQDALWARAFPSLASMKAANHAFLSWTAHGKILVREYTVVQASWPSRERPLGDAEALVARGAAKFVYERGALPKDIADALVLDPNQVEARMIESRVKDGKIDVAAARARGRASRRLARVVRARARPRRARPWGGLQEDVRARRREPRADATRLLHRAVTEVTARTRPRPRG